jgi:hypothetical protein
VALQPAIILVGGGGAVPVWTAGFVVGFNRRLVVSHIPPIPQGPVFIYVPHRRPHPHIEMEPNLNRDPVLFRELQYGGQVQNWRKLLF